MTRLAIRLVLPIFLSTVAQGATDKVKFACEKLYGDASICESIKCEKPYSDWIGTWEGPFVSSIELPDTQAEVEKMVPFLDKLKKYFPNSFGGENPKSQFPQMFRPYNNKVTYSENNCVRNIRNGDEFIFAEQEDSYPEFQMLRAETKKGLLVTGKNSNKAAFLKTWNPEFGLVEYDFAEKDESRDLSIWKKDFGGGMTMTIIDGRDLSVKQVHKRHVTLVLTIKAGSFNFEAPITMGHHSQSRQIVYAL